ncbi:MAG: VOC family protein [Gemmatimonadetes bacterium]|nr:VOC family protein [Gemmatimonadota bacterium]
MTRSDAQTPSGREVYLDHVGWFVDDMDQASRAFERLGFVLTPFVVSRNADPAGGPPKPSGTGNRCAMLRRGYLELIAGIEGVDTSLGRQHREAVARYVGLHVVAFTVADAETAQARLATEGFAPGEPARLRRPIKAPDGSDALAKFTVIRVPPDKMPEGRIQVLTQETPDLIWQPQLIARDSGLEMLGSALLCVDDPSEAAARYGRFVGRPTAGSGDCVTMALDRGRLIFATPKRCGTLLAGSAVPDPPSIAAIGLLTKELDATRHFLASRAVGVVQVSEDVFCICPADAMGAGIVFHQPGAVWPV